MGKIVYKPHCGKCGTIIDQEITYDKFDGFTVIEPSRCPRCREVFEVIEIPVPKKRNDILQDRLVDYPWIKEESDGIFVSTNKSFPR